MSKLCLFFRCSDAKVTDIFRVPRGHGGNRERSLRKTRSAPYLGHPGFLCVGTKRPPARVKKELDGSAFRS